MEDIQKLFDNNRLWAEGKSPAYFEKLAEKQTPNYLWIGCSDSRVPPNEILGLGPGEVFVHRNIANLFSAKDVSAHSVLEYATLHLHVKHIIVCGHTNCGGVLAAMKGEKLGVIDEWIAPIAHLYAREKEVFSKLPEEERYDALIKRNVLQQTKNIAEIPFIKTAPQKPHIHAWLFDLKTGLLSDLNQ